MAEFNGGGELHRSVLAGGGARVPTGPKSPPIGSVTEIAGSGGLLSLDLSIIESLMESHDPALSRAGQIGAQVKLRVGTLWIVASVRSLRADPAHPGHAIAAIDFQGEGEEDRLTGKFHRFHRGVTRFPVPGTPVYPLNTEDMQQIYAAEDRPHIEVGNVYPTQDIRAALYIDAMLGKHFALLGSTGTGKSTAAALILHRICDMAPQGHIVMIDPHGEYAAAFSGNGALYNVSNLAMPYWLMNFEEHCEVFLTTHGSERQVDADILSKCLLAAKAKNRIGQAIARLTVDAPVPYLLSDLIMAVQNEMGRMDKATDTAPYLRIKSKVEEIKADPRYAFMFSGLLMGDTMADFLARIFRLPGEGKPISIIDLSGVPSEITSVVVAVLSRMVFDFAIWSRTEPHRPILLVCEEAHRYVPSDRNAEGSAVAHVLGRIAKEGRKYGVALGLITQRPSDLAEGVLSQCGTIIAMRLNNERDQARVRAAMPEGARGFLDAIPALRNRECIICGEGVATPVRVAFDTLEEARRPASDDPVFSTLWTETGGEAQILERTIQRWRTQGR